VQREHITVVEAEFSLQDIAAALKLTPDDVARKYRDPRIVSWFAEIWGERLFGYKKHVNSNHPGSDGAIHLGAMGRFDISVRCFNTNGIKFQKSKFIGSGRKATQEDLIESIESVERYVLVDLRQFPVLRFFPIDSKALLRLIRHGKLTTSGIGSNRFDVWVSDVFDLTVARIALGPATGAMG
jgi:hypothetical protein